MRLATITNWTYGTTVALTIVSGTTIVLASNAQDYERTAQAQRYRLDQETHDLVLDVFGLADQARQYVILGDANHLAAYERSAQTLEPLENRLRNVQVAGASADESKALKEAVRLADGLQDEQRPALAASQRGDEAQARQILFGTEYECELDRVRAMIERFQYRLDQRTNAEVQEASNLTRLWKSISEIVLGLTGFRQSIQVRSSRRLPVGRCGADGPTGQSAK